MKQRIKIYTDQIVQYIRDGRGKITGIEIKDKIYSPDDIIIMVRHVRKNEKYPITPNVNIIPQTFNVN